MNRFWILTGLALAFSSGPPSFAQEAMTTTDPNSGAYDALSPGEKSIVDAIYESHLETTASETTTTNPTAQSSTQTTEPMTPDDIAAMKADAGWGKTYNDLYAQGKVTYKNLGQAISAHKRSLNPSTSGTTTVVTTGGGQQVLAGGKKSGVSAAHGPSQGAGNKFGQNKPTVVTSGGGGPAFSGAAAHSNAGGVSGMGGANGRGRSSGSPR